MLERSESKENAAKSIPQGAGMTAPWGMPAMPQPWREQNHICFFLPPAVARRGILSELVVKVNDILSLVYSKVRLPQAPIRQRKPSGGRDV